MVKYNYTAIDKNGNEIKESIDAVNINEAETIIRDKGYYLSNIFESKKSLSEKFSNAGINIGKNITKFRNAKINDKEYSAFVRQIATLIEAGIPIVRAIDILTAQQKNPNFKKILTNISNDISSGLTFSDALSAYPKIFNKLFISMSKAGEAGGVLNIILDRLAEFSEQSRILKSRIKSAFVYPIVVVSVSIILVSILMLVVIPKFEEIFVDIGANLPLPTVVLINISAFLQSYWWVLIFLIVLLIVLYKILLKARKIRLFFDKIKFKMPVFGEIVQRINIIRFARTLGTLITSGVPILQSLNIVKDTTNNLLYEDIISDLYNSISEGDSISAPLERVSAFPPIVVNMIQVGEETGVLDKMLLKIASIYELELDIMVTSLTKLLEPVLIVIMAVIVAYIVISMFMPLVSLMSTLSG